MPPNPPKTPYNAVSLGKPPTPIVVVKRAYIASSEDPEAWEGEPIACQNPGCYLAVNPRTGFCTVHGYPR